mgnify:CR=1 FL=1
MSKNKELSKEAKKLNDKIIQLSKTTKTKPKKIKSIGTIQFLSPNASIYKNTATIFLKGKPIENDDKKKEKLLEFLSRAPISFDDE